MARAAARPTAAPESSDNDPPPARPARSPVAPGRRLLPLAGVAAAIGVFELAPRIGLVDERFLPPASAMFAALGRLVVDGAGLWIPVGQTLQGWALGLGLAVLLALPLGILIGSVFLLFMASRSIVEFLRPIPSVALIPLAVLVFGAGLESKVFLAAWAATWPILLQTLYGVRDVDPVATETARSFGVSRRDRLLRVTLPSALPYVVTGVRISSAVALILVVTAELVLGAPGLGQEINIARQSAAVDTMYALIIVTGLIGWGLNALLARIEARLLAWHPSHREQGR
ncbi:MULTISPECIES: ABC transporter permease [Pseudonocardia]|uniref:Nitrate ABC transporter permease n=2 Tax=Pseudonocardia TaxID=1847 RepID=A0ABQ0RQZ2_9PSEU|nr:MULTISPECIES: ABC transporter permease [Pseudonocardia]OSY39154.1 putative aliphatic sulfonates transport permease protein SsuC [Pseudonocardia autotrophica]TDN71251.1 ABC-type nitrate/sulfonate/bicarbonate transport system permease component [Pseudonocardia autotrophica]BBG01923.1 nitrate ABC transporter permease [Pseudonocardia autotrophica]GEC23087.1 nitrate ABC transporter permease [Pseudonocardia saturnea]